jgi:hypothetical protein
MHRQESITAAKSPVQDPYSCCPNANQRLR